METLSDTEKLSNLKLKLNREIIRAYERIMSQYSSDSKFIIETLQYSRKENTGEEIVKIELKRDEEYLPIINRLSDIQNKNSRKKWIGEQILMIDRNEELLNDL